MKRTIQIFLSVLTLSIFSSCNVYTPFNTNGTDLDKLEEAQFCLKESDWECAIEQYQKLEDNTLKQQKLCQVYLSRGGITLSVLVNTLNQDTDQLLINLGNELIPWTSNKSTDLNLAKTHCGNFNSLSPSADAVFLKTTSLLAHCAIRLARTDRFQAISTDDTCTMSNITSNGFLTVADVCQSSDGSLNESGTERPGMCSDDVNACKDDILAVKDVESDLTSLGLLDIAGAVGKLPTDITDGVTTQAARLALKGMFH